MMNKPKTIQLIYGCRQCLKLFQNSVGNRALSSYQFSRDASNFQQFNASSPIRIDFDCPNILWPPLIHKRKYRPSWFAGESSGVSKAVSQAEKIVGYPTSFLSLRCLLSDELSNVALQMRKLVGTKHPLLKTARRLVFDGKHNLQMRGLLVMLISKAAGPSPHCDNPDYEMVSGVYPSQRSLAEITEVIHTANLIHKGVVNLDTFVPDPDGMMANMEFGNKMAVLSGDFLLASACTGLAKLENPSVMEQVASSIGDMMTAEFTNFTDRCGNPQVPITFTGFADWLQLTYLSLGSLLAKSCQSAMILAGHSQDYQQNAFSFGENLTYAQQLCSDMIPFMKPDELSSLSVTSAPVLLYAEQTSKDNLEQLKQLWQEGTSNYKTIVDIVSATSVLDQCKQKCQEYRDKSITALDCFKESEAKDALINMATVVSEIR